jgi:hypothetical protein
MANVHIQQIEDRNGDLVELVYFCHTCGIDRGVPGWPAPESLDYNVYCADCGLVLLIPLTLDGQREMQEHKDNI